MNLTGWTTVFQIDLTPLIYHTLTTDNVEGASLGIGEEVEFLANLLSQNLLQHLRKEGVGNVTE